MKVASSEAVHNNYSNFLNSYNMRYVGYILQYLVITHNVLLKDKTPLLIDSADCSLHSIY